MPILPSHVPWVEAIQAYLADVGINMEISISEPGTQAREIRSGEWAIATGGIGANHPHGDALAHFLPDAPNNPHGYVDEHALELIDRAAQPTLTDEERSEIYQELSMYIVEEAWYLATHYTDSLNAYNPEAVSEPTMIFREPVASVFGIRQVGE